MDKLEVFFQDSDITDDDSNLLRREVAYERIKDAIQYANMLPGDSLSEVKLSKLLGISRTPIREALHQLAREGFVQLTPGKGVTIAQRSLKEVMDAVHIRLLLEPEQARLAARSGTDEELAAMQECVEIMEACIDPEDYAQWVRADEDFHDILNNACPNPMIGKVVGEMRNRIHHLANAVNQMSPKRIVECTEEHRRIVDAIAARDEERAEQMMLAHIQQLRASIFDRLSYS
jgi:DNA-binding GntR family transcriptional regulator